MYFLTWRKECPPGLWDFRFLKASLVSEDFGKDSIQKFTLFHALELCNYAPFSLSNGPTFSIDLVFFFFVIHVLKGSSMYLQKFSLFPLASLDRNYSIWPLIFLTSILHTHSIFLYFSQLTHPFFHPLYVSILCLSLARNHFYLMSYSLWKNSLYLVGGDLWILISFLESPFHSRTLSHGIFQCMKDMLSERCSLSIARESSFYSFSISVFSSCISKHLTKGKLPRKCSSSLCERKNSLFAMFFRDIIFDWVQTPQKLESIRLKSIAKTVYWTTIPVTCE